MTIAQSTTMKLDPGHIKVSGKFTAILAYLLGEKWTDPAITELVITSDGIVLAADTNDPFFDSIIGDEGDLDCNLHGVSTAAGLTDAEQAYLMTRAARIRRA